jgi:hypothetical protein
LVMSDSALAPSSVHPASVSSARNVAISVWSKSVPVSVTQPCSDTLTRTVSSTGMVDLLLMTFRTASNSPANVLASIVNFIFFNLLLQKFLYSINCPDLWRAMLAGTVGEAAHCAEKGVTGQLIE